MFMAFESAVSTKSSADPKANKKKTILFDGTLLIITEKNESK